MKSCLVCMSSYCESHLKHHQGQKSMRQHELIGPTGQLAQKICTEHKYLQEFYCRPCGRFVCWLCTSNQHKGHECVSTKAERVEKQVRRPWEGRVMLWGEQGFEETGRKAGQLYLWGALHTRGRLKVLRIET